MYVTISHLEMWFRCSFMHKKDKQCFHSCGINYLFILLAFLRSILICILNLSVTEIFFKTDPVMLLDYGLLLWNRPM